MLSKIRKIYNKNYANLLTEVNVIIFLHVMTNYLYNKLPFNIISPYDYKIYQEVMLKTLLYSHYFLVSKKEMVLSPAEQIID